MYLFETRRHAPATGLHDAVVAAHVLSDLPVLLPPLLPAGQQSRVTEERRNTVTGQSASDRREEREERERERGEALAAWPASSKRQKRERRRQEENKATAVVELRLIRAQAKQLFYHTTEILVHLVQTSVRSYQRSHSPII